MSYKLSEINIYPVKSLGGIALQSAEVTDRGLKYDRRWMVIDNEGKFITQRTISAMSLIKTEIDYDRIIFSHKLAKLPSISFNLNEAEGESLNVIVWNDSLNAVRVKKEIDEWLSAALDIKCRLVYMPDNSRRLTDQKYSSNNEIVSFADAFPFLIIGQQSLNDLNSRLEEKVPMNRFRPNFVFEGGEPFDEDRWKKFKIGNVMFYAVKPCARCVVTTVNQETAEKKEEPLKTLSKYRTQENKVMFGQNLLHEGMGTIQIGDELEVLEWK